jgi:hypothetical protein
MGMPQVPVRDIMRRTIQNLEFIERHAGADGPYEVTQLLNSFLGALAHPWEAYRDDLATVRLEAAHEAGWPRIVKELTSDREPDSLGDLVGLMRNAVAHGNIALLPSAASDIRALRLWNINRGRRTWGTIITVADMRAFLVCFVALAEQLYDNQVVSRSQIA